MQAQTHTRDGKVGLFKASLEENSSHGFYAREGVDPLTHAFDRKIAVHAGFGGRPLPGPQGEARLGELLDRPRVKGSAVYIHVPFCESHCLYCGFYNRAYQAEESVRFTDALLGEIDLWRGRAALGGGPVGAVYIGGGTPTALEAGDLYRILTSIKSTFPLTNDCEITVEGRIHNFGPEKMAACLDGGANRFSIGVQTFHTPLRRAMRRIADRQEIVATIDRLRSDGRAVVVIDLIFGFPGQTMEMWREDIETFLSLAIDGVDLYQLNVFKNSPLATAVSQGKLPPAADLSQQARMFALGGNLMTGARYRRLSMSHWGHTTRERNIYNHLMKGPSECLAFGPGAGGSLGGHFYFVDNDYSRWLVAVNSRRKPVSIVVAPRPLAELEKIIAAGFDLGVLDLARLETDGGRPAREMLAPLLEQWWRAGLIELDDNWLTPTEAGEFWHVNLAHLMIEYLHRQSPAREER